MINDYKKIEAERPFFILHKDPKKQDITVWQKRADGYGLVIFFHGENFWCNPPTDSSIESRAYKAIERYGIAYLTEPDAYIEGYKKCAWNEAGPYRQAYADKFFGRLNKKSASYKCPQCKYTDSSYNKGVCSNCGHTRRTPV